MDEEKPGTALRIKEEPENDSGSTKAEGSPQPENDKSQEPKVERRGSCGEEEDEEDPLAPAEITAKRESHAPQVDLNLLHKEPDFAVVCSFFNKFGSMMGMKPLSFTKLESLLTSFEPDGHVNKELMDIHMMLMRRIRMLSVRAENWENYLKKFLAMNEVTEGELFQVERYGYVNLPVSSKIQILKALCDAQFDYNARLRESMTTACRANNLRLIPLGMDKNGLVYWFQQDADYNIRIYTEEPDDQSGVTWTLAVNTPEQLDELIEKLKSEDLGYLKKESDGKEKKYLNADPEAQMPMSTKKGTFVDLHLDEAAIKRMREFLMKQKEERKNKREGKVQKAESEKEEEVEEEEQVEEDLDKRVMPRRSAASRAVSNIRKFATPSRKSGPRKKKAVEEDGDEEEKESGAEEKEGEEKKESSEGSGSDVDDEDEEEGDFSDEESEEDDDDEFKPKSDKPKRKRRKRGPRKQKKKALVDDEDEDDDSDEEEVKKERKLATGESACGQCKKSGDWDVLLLCDVCDDAWHTYCLKPMLWFVPDGDWFCPKCVHGMLVEKLEEVGRVLGENLKKRSQEDKKKKAAADRLRREMEYIGVSLNNIIPVSFKDTAIPSSSSSDEDTTQRKSKRKAVKKIAPRSRFHMEVVQTIAEGRSRRRTQRVDYNFKDYDEAIQDACAELGQKSRSHSPTGEIVRPTGGAGRGKDMANILEAEEKRRAGVDENAGDEEGAERLTGKPVKIKLPKHRRKLNDLNADDEDSDSEEYQANESEVEAAEEEEILSGSEYVPSGDERRLRSGRTRSGRNGPTQSDEDFVVSDSDGSYGYKSKQKKKKEKAKKKKKRGRNWESSEESEEESEESAHYYSDDSEEERKKKKRRSVPVKWKAAQSDEEEQEDEEELENVENESDSNAPKTQAGRPMRRTVAKIAKLEESDEDEEDDAAMKKFIQRPVGALDRIRQKKGSDSEGEFKPDEEEEEEEEDEEEELPMEKKKGVKRRIESSDEDDDEEKVDDSKRLAPPPKLLKKSLTIPAQSAKSTALETFPCTTSTDAQPPCKPSSIGQNEEKPFATTSVSENGCVKIPTANGSTSERPPPAAKAETAPSRSVKVKMEPASEQHTAPSGDVKPLTVQPVSTAAQPQQATPPVQKQMTVPPATYAGPMPPGPYPPHPGYYQGAPPHAGMPPYSRAPPSGQPYLPYGGPPPTSHWQTGPYVPPPGVPNPYAPVHNPYAQPPVPTSSASNSFNDLQSL